MSRTALGAVRLGVLDAEARLAAIAAMHHGVFTTDHARQAGFSPDEIHRRLAAGVWVDVHRGVYRSASLPLPWQGKLLAACWAGGFRAYASHRSAAAMWQLPGGRQDLIEITCPRWRRARHPTLVTHETKAFHRIDIRLETNVPVTTPARTLLDLGAVCSPTIVELAADRALNRGLTTREEIDRVLMRLGRSGRNGAGVLRSIVRRRGSTLGKPESPMETRVLQVLRRAGLPAPELQYEIRENGHLIARADAAYPQWRIAIEYDSDEFHTGVEQRRHDSTRRNALLRADWLQITAHADDVYDGGRDLVATIKNRAHRFGVT